MCLLISVGSMAYLTFKHLADTFIKKTLNKEDPLLNILSSQDIN